MSPYTERRWLLIEFDLRGKESLFSFFKYVGVAGDSGGLFCKNLMQRRLHRGLRHEYFLNLEASHKRIRTEVIGL